MGSFGLRGRAAAEFIGRSAELAAWSEHVRGLPHAGGVLVLSGEPGIGKSRLQQQFEAYASDAGVRILRLRCREADSASAYRPLIDALAPLARPGGPLNRPAPPAYRTALAAVARLWEGGPHTTDEDEPIVLAESAVRVLSMLAGGRGLAVSVEDVQWADPETYAVLEHLARTVDAAPIAASVTARTSPTGRERTAGLTDTPAGSVVELTRLDRSEQRAMMTAMLGSEPPAEVMDFVIGRAEGLPLAIEELLADLLRQNALSRVDGRWVSDAERFDSVSAPSIEASVAARVTRLDSDAVAVAIAVALGDEESTWDQIAAVTGQSSEGVMSGLRNLMADDLMVTSGRGRYHYRHGLIRDAVVTAAAPSITRQVAHRAAERLVRDTGTDPGRWARVAGLRDRAGEADAASAAHREAARLWLERGAAATAVSSARAALARAESARLRCDAADTLSEALARMGEFAEALALLDSVLGWVNRGDTGRLGVLHCRAARCATESGAPRAAQTHLDDAERLDAAGHDIAAQRATLAFESGDLPAATALAARAVTLAEQLDDSDALGTALLVQARVLRAGEPADALPGLERLHRLALTGGQPVLLERSLLELGLVDRLTTNRADRLEAAYRLAVERGALHTQAVAEMNLWPVVSDGGDLARAECLARHAVELSGRHRLRTVLTATVMLVLHEAIRGRAAESAALQERLAGTYLASTGVFYHRLFTGAPEEALVAIEHTAGVLDRVPDAHAAPARGLHALLAAVLNGDAEPARKVAAAGVGADYNRGLVRLAEAVVAGMRGDSAAAGTAASQGYGDLAPFPTMSAIATVLLAPQAFDRGWEDPAGRLVSARDCFGLLGNEILRRRCDQILRAAGRPVPRRGRGDAAVPASLRSRGVTSREMDVLLLVAQHLTNAEIAEVLALSPRTVETHVSRLLAKAQVSTRGDLAALLD